MFWFSEADDEYLQLLLAQEADCILKGEVFDASADDGWLKCCRLEAFRGILKVGFILNLLSSISLILSILFVLHLHQLVSTLCLVARVFLFLKTGSKRVLFAILMPLCLID